MKLSKFQDILVIKKFIKMPKSSSFKVAIRCRNPVFRVHIIFRFEL